MRERTAWAVAQATGGGRIVEPLIIQLQAPDWRARSYAAWALALTQDGRATDALIRTLRDPHWRVRGHAAFALDEIGDPKALSAMRDALRDETWQVRIDAVEFISKHAGAEAPEILRRVQAEDPHPLVRKEAAQELAARD